MDEIEIANRVLEARREEALGEAPIAAAWTQKPTPGSFKVPGPGCWYETFDGQLEWREGSSKVEAERAA